MLNEGRPFLNVLDTLLGDRGKDTLYPCIRDLVEHGLDLPRFAAGEMTPQRQDITQYLAAWSRHAGLSEEEASAWLVDYCAAVLVAISRRTPAAVRHSTKSNLRYIYRSAVPFLCHGANNPFRADCRPDCPVYADMQAKLHAKAIELAQPRPVVRPPAPVIVSLSVKAANLEQFQTGLRLALDEVQKGTKMRRIVELLNERGLKTRTGRDWKYGILRNELQALKNSHVPPQNGGQGASPPERPNAEQECAAPNGGPAASVGNSGVTEGPPSMS
jgi:hypothetical protein